MAPVAAVAGKAAFLAAAVSATGPTEEDLLNACGLPREKLDKALSTLEKLKSIELRGGQWFVVEAIWMKIS